MKKSWLYFFVLLMGCTSLTISAGTMENAISEADVPQVDYLLSNLKYSKENLQTFLGIAEKQKAHFQSRLSLWKKLFYAAYFGAIPLAALITVASELRYLDYDPRTKQQGERARTVKGLGVLGSSAALLAYIAARIAKFRSLIDKSIQVIHLLKSKIYKL